MNLIGDFVEGDGFEGKGYEEMLGSFRVKTPARFNFAYDVVDKYAALAPEKRALVWCDDFGGERTMNFAEMSAESKRAANVFKSLGIVKGDYVMLILRRRWEFWPVLLALHRIGAVAVPATNQLLAKDIEYRTNAANIKMIVAVDEVPVVAAVEAAMDRSPSVKTLVLVRSGAGVCAEPKREWTEFRPLLREAPAEFPRPEGDAATGNDDIMLMYFTSGTSGYPKMVQHNFLYPLGHISTAKLWQNVIDDGLHLSVAETGWAKAMWGKIYGQWICGSAVFVYDMVQFKPYMLMQKLEHYAVTTFCAPPTVYRYLIRTDISKFDLSAMRYFATAGEALNPEVYTKVLEMTGLKLHEGYGQTECTLLAGNFVGMEPKPGSMGRPAPGYDIAVLDADGKECAPGEVGSLVIRLHGERPVGMFSGYHKDDELTRKAFEGGIYHTGDTAYADEDGYLWFVGRDDDLIKTSGYRVSPFEVESVFQQHPAVLECAVTGVKDKHRGQAIKASVVLTKGIEATVSLEHEILEFVKSKTASYKHPRILEFVKELPKTISGKIRRVEIRENDEKRGGED